MPFAMDRPSPAPALFLLLARPLLLSLLVPWPAPRLVPLLVVATVVCVVVCVVAVVVAVLVVVAVVVARGRRAGSNGAATSSGGMPSPSSSTLMATSAAPA